MNLWFKSFTMVSTCWNLWFQLALRAFLLLSCLLRAVEIVDFNLQVPFLSQDVLIDVLNYVLKDLQSTYFGSRKLCAEDNAQWYALCTSEFNSSSSKTIGQEGRKGSNFPSFLAYCVFTGLSDHSALWFDMRHSEHHTGAHQCTIHCDQHCDWSFPCSWSTVFHWNTEHSSLCSLQLIVTLQG